MLRTTELTIEGRAYLAQARDLCRSALSARAPNHVLSDIAGVREALHEAAMRFAELKKIEDADDNIPF